MRNVLIQELLWPLAIRSDFRCLGDPWWDEEDEDLGGIGGGLQLLVVQEADRD